MYNDWHKLQNRFQDDSPSMDLEKAWSSMQAERQSREKNDGDNRKYFWFALGLLLLICSVSLYFAQDALFQSGTVQLEKNKINKSSKFTEITAVSLDSKQEEIIATEKHAAGEPAQVEASKNKISVSNLIKEKLVEPSSFEEKKYASTQRIHSEDFLNNIASSINHNSVEPQFAADSERPMDSKDIISKEVAITRKAFVSKQSIRPLRITESAPHIPLRNHSKVKKLNKNLSLPNAKYDFYKDFHSALGLSVSYGLNIRTLESTINVNDTWVERRNQVEQAKDVFGIELFYQKFLSKRFFITAGLNYTKWTDQLNYEYNEERIVSLEDVVVEIKYLNDGTVEEMLGTVDAIETQDYIATVWQKQSYVSVPILLGSHFPFDQKSGINIALGVQVPIYRSVIGRTVNRSNPILGIELIDQETFKKNGPLQLLSNVSYVQSLGRSNRFHFGLKSSFDLSSRINEAEGISLKHFGIQLSTGVAKLF